MLVGEEGRAARLAVVAPGLRFPEGRPVDIVGHDKVEFPLVDQFS